MARPTKRTPQLERSLLQALRLGNTRTAACQYVGIDLGQLARWERRFADFARAVEEAEASAELRLVGRLIEAADGGDVGAIRYWLERRRPETWAPKQSDAGRELGDALAQAFSRLSGAPPALPPDVSEGQPPG